MDKINSIKSNEIPGRESNSVIFGLLSRITLLRKRKARYNSKITNIYQNQKKLAKMNTERLTAVTGRKPNSSSQIQHSGGIKDE